MTRRAVSVLGTFASIDMSGYRSDALGLDTSGNDAGVFRALQCGTDADAFAPKHSREDRG